MKKINWHKIWRSPQFYWWLAVGLIFVVWSWTRFANLSESFWFWDDAGRDGWYLWQWWAQGKIPFLGPRTSALPINTSPFYFYLLFPSFVLMQQSYFYAHVTLFIFTWTIWSGLIWLTRGQPRRRQSLLMLMTLCCLAPPMIAQSRWVWNPSFIWQMVLAAFYLLLCLPRKKWAIITSGALTVLAASFNFSAIPAVLAIFIVMLIQNRRQWLAWCLGAVGSGVIAFLPTLVYEAVKSNWQITR